MTPDLEDRSRGDALERRPRKFCTCHVRVQKRKPHAQRGVFVLTSFDLSFTMPWLSHSTEVYRWDGAKRRHRPKRRERAVRRRTSSRRQTGLRSSRASVSASSSSAPRRGGVRHAKVVVPKGTGTGTATGASRPVSTGCARSRAMLRRPPSGRPCVEARAVPRGTTGDSQSTGGDEPRTTWRPFLVITSTII